MALNKLTDLEKSVMMKQKIITCLTDKEYEKLSVINDLITKGEIETCIILLENNLVDITKINYVNVLRFSPLMQASLKGYYKLVELLIKHGANLESKDKYGNTALSIVCSEGMRQTDSFKIAKLLIESGANPNTQNNYDKTPLERALAFGNYYWKNYRGIINLLTPITYLQKDKVDPSIINIDASIINIDKILDEQRQSLNELQQQLIKDNTNKITAKFIQLASDPKPEIIHDAKIINLVCQVKIWINGKWSVKNLATDNINLRIPSVFTNLEYHVLPAGVSLDNNLTTNESYVKFPSNLSIFTDGFIKILGTVYRKE